MMRAEGMKITNATRKVRSDKKHRVGGPYLDDDTYKKLKRISKACDTTPPKILEDMAKYLLNHPNWVAYIQDRYKVETDDPFRITPIIENGKVNY